MDRVLIFWLIYFLLLAWGSSLSILTQERNYSKYTLPKKIKAILFPFQRNSFTLHNIVCMSSVYLLSVLFLLLYFMWKHEGVIWIWLFVLLILFVVNMMVYAVLDFIYWFKNRKKPKTIQPIIFRKGIAYEMSKIYGFQKGQTIDTTVKKDLQINKNAVNTTKDIFNSLSYHMEYEEFKLNDRGNKIKMLQKFLGIKVTGEFDEDTYNAVIELQNKLDIPPDGIFSPKIIDAIVDYLDNRATAFENP